MESVASANVNTWKFLSLDASNENPTNPKWRCCEVALKMLEEGIYTDITLDSKGGSVKAHKSVLARASPVFYAMFQHDMKEQLTSTVDILDMTIDALQLFLILLYNTKEASNESLYARDRQMPHFNAAIDEHFDEFYKAVLKYQVESRLGPLVMSALARNLTPDNCWFYDSSLTAIRGPTTIITSAVCKLYVLGNYHDVIKSNSFLQEMGRNSDRVHSMILSAESR